MIGRFEGFAIFAMLVWGIVFCLVVMPLAMITEATWSYVVLGVWAGLGIGPAVLAAVVACFQAALEDYRKASA